VGSTGKQNCYFLLTMDCERVQKKNFYPAGPPSWKESENNIVAFGEIALKFGYKATFFAVPEAVEKHSNIFRELIKYGHEVGLHLHPETFRFGVNEYLGNLPYNMQFRIIKDARDVFSKAMGFLPSSFRPGFFSANHDTFRALTELGFRRGNCVIPGRYLSGTGGNWKGWYGQCSYINSYFEAPLTVRHYKKGLSWFFHLQSVMDTMINGFFFAAVKKSIIPVYNMIRHMNSGLNNFHIKNENKDFILDLRIENGEYLVLRYVVAPELNRVKRESDFPVLMSLTHNYINYTDAHYGKRELGISRKKCLVRMLDYLNNRKDVSVKSRTLDELQNEYDRKL